MLQMSLYWDVKQMAGSTETAEHLLAHPEHHQRAALWDA